MQTTYRVEGMTCQHCVAAVTEEVGALTGVSSVNVDLATGDVVVDSDGALDRTAVAAAVDEAGYTLV
ncbi:MAG: heavy-metal-associated domain-containing protein [Rhodococcus sp.]|uniref:heavy-metal-associated domain-containing protein n=1 Tax=Rhodococcus TaxID=1827 RepID=UPI00169852AF|nr:MULTISPECIES: copper ion binding protein [Rhodococcus]NLV80371.1 heavy-metal-associated domain-containing protein [Rhodococcus sp. (in: high G+C Gram-positive bacteria)]